MIRLINTKKGYYSVSEYRVHFQSMIKIEMEGENEELRDQLMKALNLIQFFELTTTIHINWQPHLSMYKYQDDANKVPISNKRKTEQANQN